MSREMMGPPPGRELLTELGLNSKQLRFVLAVFSGHCATVAYGLAYKNLIPVRGDGDQPSKIYSTCSSCGSRMLNNAKIQQALERMHFQEAIPTFMDRGEKRGLLALMGRGVMPDIKPVDRVRSIREDNKMANEYSPDRTDEGELYDPFDEALEAAQHAGN